MAALLSLSLSIYCKQRKENEMEIMEDIKENLKRKRHGGVKRQVFYYFLTERTIVKITESETNEENKMEKG